jgi:ribonuclease P protein component
MEKGKVYHSPLFLLRAIRVDEVGDNKTRVSAVVPNKVAKRATARNRTKRVMYGAVRPFFGEIKEHFHIIVFAKAGALSAEKNEAGQAMREIFVKAGLLR